MATVVGGAVGAAGACCGHGGAIGGGRSSGTGAGATRAARARADPPHDTPKESSLVGVSKPSGKGGGRTDAGSDWRTGGGELAVMSAGRRTGGIRYSVGSDRGAAGASGDGATRLMTGVDGARNGEDVAAEGGRWAWTNGIGAGMTDAGKDESWRSGDLAVAGAGSEGWSSGNGNNSSGLAGGRCDGTWAGSSKGRTAGTAGAIDGAAGQGGFGAGAMPAGNRQSVGVGCGDGALEAGGNELTGTAGSSNGTGQSRAWGAAGGGVTAGAGGCGNEGAMGAAGSREGSNAESLGSGSSEACRGGGCGSSWKAVGDGIGEAFQALAATGVTTALLVSNKKPYRQASVAGRLVQAAVEVVEAGLHQAAGMEQQTLAAVAEQAAGNRMRRATGAGQLWARVADRLGQTTIQRQWLRGNGRQERATTARRE